MQHEREENENHVSTSPTPPASFTSMEVDPMSQKDPMKESTILWGILGLAFFIYMMLAIFQ